MIFGPESGNDVKIFSPGDVLSPLGPRNSGQSAAETVVAASKRRSKLFVFMLGDVETPRGIQEIAQTTFIGCR